MLIIIYKERIVNSNFPKNKVIWEWQKQHGIMLFHNGNIGVGS